MILNDFIKKDWNKWYLRVKITPKSIKTEIFSVLEDNTVKIRIKSPAEKWKANKELIEYLSIILKIPKIDIDIIHGRFSNIKEIQIKNKSKEYIFSELIKQ